MKKDTFAQTLLIAIFALPVLALPIATALPEPESALPQAHVEIAAADVEIEFVPTHSLYQKRCIVDGELVYCADTAALRTVSVVDSEIEIDFVADAE